MKVLKPEWINHNGKPICSIDIHPDGSRVATGGQGEDSGRVVIWNMRPVVSEPRDDESIPRMLCQLDNHLACVNCVRWSWSGKYLASGGDDKLVMVWTISKSAAGNTVFGSKGKVNLEGWRCYCTLRRHQGDILDMAWSPNDLWLATCSVDNTIIIWRADNLPEVVTVLHGHTGLVKGVCWDPVGKYLSSQSDDNTVRVWRTSDWGQETVIKEPFQKCSPTTLVLRLSWSPDGQYLVTAHAMNGSVPTAQIIEREGWVHDKDFVGHCLAVTCVRFSSFILETERKGKVCRSCVCAMGSRDRSVSVWITCLKRPVVVLEDLFSSPVLDLSWGPRGQSFMAVSGDGTAAYLEFTPDEIGRPISESDKATLFEKLYGKAHVGQHDMSALVIEHPDVLMEVENNVEVKKETTDNGSIVNNSSASRSNSNQDKFMLNAKTAGLPTTKQIETRRADGKRRITPIFIPPQPDTGNEVLPFGSENSFSSFSWGKNKAFDTKEETGTEPVLSGINHSLLVERVASSCPQPSQVTSAPAAPSTQTTAAAPAPKPVTTPAPASTPAPAPSQPPPKKPPSPPSEGGFTMMVTAAEKAAKVKKRPTVESTSPKKIKKEKKERDTVRGKRAEVGSGPSGTGSSGKCSGCSRSVRLPSLRMEPSSSVKVADSKDSIQVENNSSRGAQGSLSTIKYCSPYKSKPVWQYMFGCEVTCCTATGQVSVVSTADGLLHVLCSGSGRPLSPPLALPSPPALLCLTPAPSRALVLVTAAPPLLYLWTLTDTLNLRPTFASPIDLDPILPHDGGEVKVKECFVNDQGEPLLALSSGKAFMFSSKSNCWLLLGNSSDSVLRHTFQSFKSHIVSTSNHGLPLKSLQSAAFNGLTGSASGPGPGMAGSEFGALCTLTYLDSQLVSARALGSPNEYKFWLIAIVRFLLQQGMGDRLRVICEELLGPAFSGSSSSTWQKEILGLCKHSLLREVLSEMSSNLKLQRLYLEFKSQLDNELRCT